MQDRTIAGEMNYWIAEAGSWPCYCGGAPTQLCHSCRITTALAAADEHVAGGDYHNAVLAVERAASKDARFESLLDRLRDAVFVDDAPYEELSLHEEPHLAVGSGLLPVVDPYAETVVAQDPSVLYECGRTYAQHKAICSDVILRKSEFRSNGEQHDSEYGIHLGLATCEGCGSTFSWPLPGNIEDMEVAP